jgi:hypothetical protein
MRPNPFHPTVEALEDRLTPSAHTFIPSPTSLGPLYASLPNFFDPNARQAANTFVGQAGGSANVLPCPGGCVQRTPAFVGQAGGSADLVGLVVGRHQALAYVCDGHSFSTWLRGPVHGARFRLTDAKGDALTARVEGGTLAGSLALRGRGHLGLVAGRAVEDQSGLFRGAVQVGTGQDILSLIRLGDQAHGAILPVKLVTCQQIRSLTCGGLPPPPTTNPAPPTTNPAPPPQPNPDRNTPPTLVGPDGKPITFPDPDDFDDPVFVDSLEVPTPKPTNS